MTREEAKDMFNMDRDSYGKIKGVTKKIDKIYDDFKSKTCESCKFRNDYRKCPMASPEAMSGNNYCYNYSEESLECTTKDCLNCIFLQTSTYGGHGGNSYKCTNSDSEFYNEEVDSTTAINCDILK